MGINQIKTRHVLWYSNNLHVLFVQIAKHLTKLTAAKLHADTAETRNVKNVISLCVYVIIIIVYVIIVIAITQIYNFDVKIIYQLS